jgi:CBS domain-containing protein
MSMKTVAGADACPRLVLFVETAADLMAPNPVSINAVATVKEAVAFFAARGFSAAPVIDEAGRPVGVLSHSDIIAHDREKVEHASDRPDHCARADLSAQLAAVLPRGFERVDIDRTQVRDIMSPVVFSVSPETPAHQAIEDLLARKIHRLFVVGKDGVLIGVISALDVLRHLRREEPPASRQPPAAPEAWSRPLAYEPW